jgi:thiamine kinase-like enzyme
VKKQIRRWSNWYKNQRKKSQLETLIGAELMPLIKSCENIISDSIGEHVYTKFRDLGGVNNLGMLMHYSIESHRAIAISKIEECLLAEREYRFLTWQKNYRRGVLSAVPIGIAKTQSYTCFISSVLEQPETFSYFQAEHLFEVMGEDSQFLSYLALDGNKENLANEIDGSTKIKSVLVNIVSQFNTNKADAFYKQFILERNSLFSSDQELYLKFKNVMHDIYDLLKTRDLKSFEGLVHGDFKPQNILTDNDGYKVIDCQYYTYGIRLWDLAFLYSKDVNGFSRIINHIDAHDLRDEKLLLVFFYLIASLMSVKQKRAKKIIEMKIIPAVEYANKIIRCSKL